MKYSVYNPQELEPVIQKFWEKNKINEKTREKNKKGKKFYYLDGPPYTSGRIHLGTAWNKSMKDITIRYQKMKGFNVWDRAGFDMHGLPTAMKVMAKHNLKTKEDIFKFGMDKFIKGCIEFSQEMMGIMIKDFERLGVTLDFKDPYQPISKEFMEGEWWFVKKAYEQKRLYHGEKVMTWCQHCETAIAKHECEYEEVKDNSVFVKLPVKGKKDEYLVIWTTTPWTLPFNLAVMANPKLDYVKVEVEGGKEKTKEKWILAKALAGPVIQAVADKKMKILKEFKGKELEGIEYVHPWQENISKLNEIKKEHKNTFTVIMSEEFVDTTAGSGLVHCAPGCGPEDQQACQPYDIPPFNSLGEDGFFPESMGKFHSLRPKIDDNKFIEDLKENEFLIETTKVDHEYPHCWRCHEPVIFRLTPQWFLKIEDLREEMLKDNEKVNWVPETANNAFKSWVSNLKDNSISRQRFWGTPLPIWTCDSCEQVDVFASAEELKKKAGNAPEDLHIPWIDEITYSCKCNGMMKRVPDIIDVWVDAGTTSWNCVYNDAKLIKELFPVDLILEAKEQTRLWFSMLSICSQIALGKNCYNNVHVHGMLFDIGGKKMSKSLGNIISPDELIDKHGADTLRYYMGQTNAGQEINFSWDECANKTRHLHIIWNVHKFLISLAKENNTNPFELDKKLMGELFSLEEKYIFSKLHQTGQKVTQLFDQFRLDETIVLIEELFLELSRTYIQMIRDKSVLGSKAEKDVCLYTISQTLFQAMKLFAPISPFITEAMYQNLKEEFDLKEESIHHCSWPEFDSKTVDLELEDEMEIAKQVIQQGLNLREKAHLGLRWPIKELVVASRDKGTIKAVEKLREIVEKQVNVKGISIMEELPGVELKVKSDYKKIGPRYEKLSPKIIAKLAMESPETILGHIEKEGTYKFKIDDTPIEIKKDDLLIDNQVPEPYLESSFRKGFVYINTERNDILDGEGFAREIMRLVQQLRKEAGLEKQDQIELFVQVSSELLEKITKFESDIKEKVGAQEIELSSKEPAKKLKFSAEKKIKKEEIKIWLAT